MRRFFPILFWFAACSSGSEPADLQRSGVVSLDFCSDLYVLAFVPHSDIVALSQDATSDFAYLNREAAGFPQIAPNTEEVLAANPAQVVRSYGGDARTLAFLERAGLDIINVGYPRTLEEVRANSIRIAEALGSDATKVPAIPSPTDKHNAASLYITPSGTTTGPGSLVHEVLTHAGFANIEERPGWHTIPLENLAQERPSHLTKGFFDSRNQFQGWWGMMRHPLAEDFLSDLPSTDLPGHLLACPAWPLFEAIDKLSSDAP